MKIWTVLAVGSVLAVCTLAQPTERRQLELRIVAEKDVYTLNERVMVKSELTNLTSKPSASQYQIKTARPLESDQLSRLWILLARAKSLSVR